MLKIPYGESDFRGMIERDYFYQDRTHYIEHLENWYSKFPVFLRPRRFGKSLFISTLHHYYGLEHKDNFQNIFAKLYIGQHPTPLANSYMVLSFEFSRIDTATHESTYRGFLHNVREGAHLFLGAYRHLFTPEQHTEILSNTTPEGYIKDIFGFTKKNEIPYKIYLLIDEYDHFANELLAFDMERFKKEVNRNGFVRKFYETLKKATSASVIDRMFITGVSPVTLDSLTSGFNISNNITTLIQFHDMMGFTHDEVKALLVKSGVEADKLLPIFADLVDWYDGYKFASLAKQPLFNPDMLLYFLMYYNSSGDYPEVMLDTNVVSDYRKIKNIFKIGDEEAARYEMLEQLVKVGHIDFTLTQLYNLEGVFKDEDFLSLLFYMGMLSFKERTMIGWRFEIPNYVIKKLYFEYFITVQLEKTRFAKSSRPIRGAIEVMMAENNPEPFFKIVETVLTEHHSNRDEMVYGEKHLQTLMIGLLCPYESYFIHSEFEAKRTYPDIFLEKMPNSLLPNDVVLELKYVKKSNEKSLPTVIKEAQTQLDGYMTSARFARPDVCGYYVVYLGGEVYKWEQWGTYV
ncbi:MAG: AAA family ATPase [Saprospiraceae bacterium]|nr:AAA family ATPase [Saprospiraceae bacterium]